MFDIGFGELVLIALVALLVLGPERLPKAARTVGALLRRARSSWQNVRGEIERELALEDLRKSASAAVANADLRREVAEAAAEAKAALGEVDAAMRTTAAAPAATAKDDVAKDALPPAARPPARPDDEHA